MKPDPERETRGPTASSAALLAWLVLLLSVFVAWSLRSGHIEIPDRWNPWAPLDVLAAPDIWTRFKLARASADPTRCRSALASAGFTHKRVEDRTTGPGCGFENAMRIEATGISVGEPFTLSCRAALSLALWERHVLQDAATTHLASPVVGMEHFGAYACRNLYGKSDARRSRHATADALDVSAFILADGRRVTVVNDWSVDSGTGTDIAEMGQGAEARFLQAAQQGACRYFDTVLGPDYNRAHADHFHFERGPTRACR